MPKFTSVTEELTVDSHGGRVALDDRFIALFLPETPQDRVESQELRQIVARALQRLTPEEMTVVEQRFQHKRSPGATASRLQMDKNHVTELEVSALAKLRGPLVDYMESRRG